MGPAEFKTLRESLGLTAQWVCNRAGVALRTLRYWEAGERVKIPKDVCAMLMEVDASFDNAVSHACAQTEGLGKNHGAPAAVTLLRYRTDADLWRFRSDMKGLPATAHAALLARLRTALVARGVTVSIIYMQPEVYVLWLAGRPDTEAARAAWAAGA